jgi:nucleotide-binding universal stress UspA family protein
LAEHRLDEQDHWVTGLLMVAVSTVLVGDDGSDTAARAVDWAIRFAGEREADAISVHASRDGRGPRRDSGLRSVTVDDTHPASAILETAAELDADLIVLGRRGAGGFPSLPIGTTAHHVAAASAQPVVVVPDDTPADQEPLVARVVVGVDGLAGSMGAASWATRVCPSATFTVVHGLDLAPALVGVEAPEGEALYERAREGVTRLMNDWCRPFMDAGVEFDTVVEEGGPAGVLIDVAARARADLVVVGRRADQPLRGMLGSVSQRVLAYAPCPAAIVPQFG